MDSVPSIDPLLLNKSTRAFVSRPTRFRTAGTLPPTTVRISGLRLAMSSSFLADASVVTIATRCSLSGLISEVLILTMLSYRSLCSSMFTGCVPSAGTTGFREVRSTKPLPSAAILATVDCFWPASSKYVIR